MDDNAGFYDIEFIPDGNSDMTKKIYGVEIYYDENKLDVYNVADNGIENKIDERGIDINVGEIKIFRISGGTGPYTIEEVEGQGEVSEYDPYASGGGFSFSSFGLKSYKFSLNKITLSGIYFAYKAFYSGLTTIIIKDANGYITKLKVKQSNFPALNNKVKGTLNASAERILLNTSTCKDENGVSLSVFIKDTKTQADITSSCSDWSWDINAEWETGKSRKTFFKHFVTETTYNNTYTVPSGIIDVGGNLLIKVSCTYNGVSGNTLVFSLPIRMNGEPTYTEIANKYNEYGADKKEVLSAIAGRETGIMSRGIYFRTYRGGRPFVNKTADYTHAAINRWTWNKSGNISDSDFYMLCWNWKKAIYWQNWIYNYFKNKVDGNAKTKDLPEREDVDTSDTSGMKENKRDWIIYIYHTGEKKLKDSRVNWTNVVVNDVYLKGNSHTEVGKGDKTPGVWDWMVYLKAKGF